MVQVWCLQATVGRTLPPNFDSRLPSPVVAWNADGGRVSTVRRFYELACGEWMNDGGKVAGMRND